MRSRTRLATIVLVSTVLAALVLTVRRGRPTRLHDGASASARHADQHTRAERLLAAAVEAREAACRLADADLLLLSTTSMHRATEILKHIRQQEAH
jgi:hypothetical protein